MMVGVTSTAAMSSGTSKCFATRSLRSSISRMFRRPDGRASCRASHCPKAYAVAMRSGPVRNRPLAILLAGCVLGILLLCGLGGLSGATAERPSYAAATCPTPALALKGVYRPSRLRVLDFCRHATGRVASVRHEPDGDLHIDVALDPEYRDLLAPANRTQQHGNLVVEFMARDGGHLPEPRVGQHIALTGAWVDDTQHGWDELHPVWAVSLNGRPPKHSGPQFGGSPEGARSYNAADDCRTASGKRCLGYSVGSGPEIDGPASRQPAPSGGGSGGGGCEPGYSPCLPRVSDLDCSEIPASKKPVHVTGSDPYRLDADHDGIGCQSG